MSVREVLELKESARAIKYDRQSKLAKLKAVGHTAASTDIGASQS